jgi:hypothetical protein
MAVHYRILEEHDLWVVVCSGFMTGEEYVDCLAEASEDKAFHWNIDLFLDLQAVSVFDLGLETLRTIQKLEEEAIKVFGPPKYSIAAIGHNSIEFNHIKLWQAFMQEPGITLHECKSVNEAAAKLERPQAVDAMRACTVELLEC